MVPDPNPAARRSLGRDVAWALAFKALALAVLYCVFFGPARQAAVTPRLMAAQIDRGR
jgi:hypothetical protein